MKRIDLEMPFGARDSELMGATYTIPEGFHAVIEGNKVIMKKSEKPSTWNEKIKGLNEFETYILSLVPDRSLDAIKVDAKNIRYIINKEQKPWSEEDEKMMDIILNDINYAQKNFSDSKLTSYDKKVEWLKSHIHGYGK